GAPGGKERVPKALVHGEGVEGPVEQDLILAPMTVVLDAVPPELLHPPPLPVPLTAAPLGGHSRELADLGLDVRLVVLEALQQPLHRSARNAVEDEGVRSEVAERAGG